MPFKRDNTFIPTPDGPAASYFPVTPSDNVVNNFGEIVRALYVGTGGNVAIVPPAGGSAVLFVNVPDGYILPLEAVRVHATGTTATNIIGLV